MVESEDPMVEEEDEDLTPKLSMDLNDKKETKDESDNDSTPRLSVNFEEKNEKEIEEDEDLTPKLTVQIDETLESVLDSDEESSNIKNGIISQEYKKIETQTSKSSSIETNSKLNESLNVMDPEFPSQEIVVKKPTIINETLGSDTQDDLSQKSDTKMRTRTKKRKRGKEIVQEQEAEEEEIEEENKNKKMKLVPKVMFTGLADEKELKKYSKMVTKLGGTISDDLKEITHLITDKVHRTKKFLCALNNCNIVSLKWV